MNNNGPKTVPWGTPENRCLSPNFAFPITTLLQRSCRYKLNHCRTFPVNPNCVHSLATRISWSIVSKAAESSNDSALELPLSCHQVLLRYRCGPEVMLFLCSETVS